MSENGDYISREAFKQEVIRLSTHPLNEWDTLGVLAAADRIPAADVVEVVRCKDCKYSEHWYRDKRLCRLWYGEEKPPAPIDVFDDGYCSYGEMRANDV